MGIALDGPETADAAHSDATHSSTTFDRGTAAGLAAHLDVLPDPSFLIDGSGRIVLANRAAGKALRSAGERAAPGAPFCGLWDASARPVAQATLGIAARETGRFDATLDGSAATFDVALSPADGHGTVLAVCRDVTGLADAKAPPTSQRASDGSQRASGASQQRAPETATAANAELSEDTFREIDHRLRNLFAMVPALVKLSMRRGGNVNAIHKAITGRVAALSRANSLSLQQAGRAEGVSLDGLISTVLDQAGADERIVTSGPPVRLATRAYNAVALTVHELATNALAHGALTRPDGRLRIAWAVEDEARSGALPEGSNGCLRLLWTETGGPPITATPKDKGFGTSTVHKLIASQHGTIEREWRRHGLNVTIDLPLYDLGAEPKYAKPLQPPRPPQANVAATPHGAAPIQALPEHEAPIDLDRRHEAALEAQIVDQIDRIVARTCH